MGFLSLNLVLREDICYSTRLLNDTWFLSMVVDVEYV
jgi:hypothetical protein